MVQLKLATTASAGLKPLGAPGQRSYELIVPAVQRGLGERHAQLFAEPVATPLGDATDWYAPVVGTAKRLAELDPETQEAVRAALGELAGDVLALADRLVAGQDAEGQRLAQALRNALEVPDEGSIFVVDGRPVLTNWAHQQDVERAPKGILSAMVPVRRSPATPSAALMPAPGGAVVSAGGTIVAARTPPDWLWWLTVAVTAGVLAAVLWLLIAPCGLAGPGWLNACPRAAQTATVDPALVARRPQLEAEIAALERQALLAERSCRRELAQAAPPPSAVPTPGAEPDAVPTPTSDPVAEPRADPVPTPAPREPARAPDEIDRRRDAAGGQQGELTVTLVWDSLTDLDLHVTCPSGETINFRNRTGCNGGRLDIDANAWHRTRTPLENVFFPGGAPHGSYRVRVNLYDAPSRYGSTHDFTVRIQTGDRTETFRGTVTNARPNWQQTFEYRG
ncbi:MAG: hypothetical protein EA406_00850 [Rhodospirillales bacterium]|nr:MAG: hypothetical protein EA406_00850 [Rhodospirillales bacterium]